jgi:pyridoxal phosphate enzyme (YggS family)
MTCLIRENLELIRQNIPSNVRLIAVTKKMSVDNIKEAYQAGIRDFGENHLQEALEKIEQLKDLTDINWHFIGHLQSNKAQKVVEKFHWIHSVDSLKLAQRLERLATDNQTHLHACLQVKLLKDPNKFGWNVDQLWQDLPILDQYQSLKIKGLMTILPLGLSKTEQLDTFQSLTNLAQEINAHSWQNLHLTELSMGMSNDYLIAIQAGSTMIRLGTIIFGQRATLIQ